MIPRSIRDYLHRVAPGFPALVITGPRQSGKTTLAKATFPDLPYENLESPFLRSDATGDPHGFLSRFPTGAILDEVQNVPDLFSYLQITIDADTAHRQRWVLTGSQQLEIKSGISQSLAGRNARVELMPFSLAEIASHPWRPRSPEEAVRRGGYPRLFDEHLAPDPATWFDNYAKDVVDRDLPQILDIRNRTDFDRFIRLCAYRVGQLVNTSEMSRQLNVDAKTIRNWLSALEACYIVQLVRPHSRNFGKRLTRHPKLYFLDTGLACRMLSIGDVNQLPNHPAWGSLFENWCFTEILKSRLNRGLSPNLWIWRSSDGHEVDFVIEVENGDLIPIEVKTSKTTKTQEGAGIAKLRSIAGTEKQAVRPGFIIHGGESVVLTSPDRFVPWHAIDGELGGAW